MAIPPQLRLFGWEEIDEPGDLERLRLVGIVVLVGRGSDGRALGGAGLWARRLSGAGSLEFPAG